MKSRTDDVLVALELKRRRGTAREQLEAAVAAGRPVDASVVRALTDEDLDELISEIRESLR